MEVFNNIFEENMYREVGKQSSNEKIITKIGIKVVNNICEVFNWISKFLKGGVTKQEKNYVTVRR